MPPAVEKATKDARKKMFKVNLKGTTIPHTVKGTSGASRWSSSRPVRAPASPPARAFGPARTGRHHRHPHQGLRLDQPQEPGEGHHRRPPATAEPRAGRADPRRDAGQGRRRTGYGLIAMQASAVCRVTIESEQLATRHSADEFTMSMIHEITSAVAPQQADAAQGSRRIAAATARPRAAATRAPRPAPAVHQARLRRRPDADLPPLPQARLQQRELRAPVPHREPAGPRTSSTTARRSMPPR